MAPASLEFVVIGAQKSGTTTLWELLRRRPDIWVPPVKELPFFSHDEVYDEGLQSLLERNGAPDDGRLRGTVTPHYMHGWGEMTTARIAARMARDCPGVKLVALLREPVARACAQHAMAAARGHDHRTLDEAMESELDPDALRAGREHPGDTNTYVVQGEYGRILSEYLAAFPAEQLHVELTADLERDPDGVLARILSFVGAVSDNLPAQPRLRLFRGGAESRVSDDECLELTGRLAAAAGADRVALAGVWAHAHPELDAEDARALDWTVARFAEYPAPLPQALHRGLRFELRKIWNVRPTPRPPLRLDLQERLAAHFAADAVRLRQAVGIDVGWSAAPVPDHEPRLRPQRASRSISSRSYGAH